jgi:hypothetical protein
MGDWINIQFLKQQITNNMKQLIMTVNNAVLEQYGFRADVTISFEDGKQKIFAELHDIDEEAEDYLSAKFWIKELDTIEDAHDWILNRAKEGLSVKLRPIISRGKWASEQLGNLDSFTL